MSNSVIDESYISKTKLEMMLLTDMQIRLMFADLVVPIHCDEDTINDWLSAFCNTHVRKQDVIGDKEYHEYIVTDNDLAWLRQFKDKIINHNWRPDDVD